MSKKSASGGPNIGLLLLIPAAAIIARGAMRHRQMLWAEVGDTGTLPPHRHGGRRGFAGPGSEAWARGEFRLPPRIEAMLDTWHAQAHAAADAKETVSV